METIMMSHICFPRDPDDYELVTYNSSLPTDILNFESLLLSMLYSNVAPRLLG